MIAEHQTTLAAGALALCWTFESILPAVDKPTELGATRTRHLILGLVNAVPAILIAAGLAVVSVAAARSDLGLLHATDPSLLVRILLSLLILDFVQYAGHVLMHKIPVLWRMHAVHHHAEHVEATTAFRFHTLEIIIHALMTAAVILLAGIQLRDVAIYNAILVPCAMFHHANIQLPPRVERVLAWFIVTPGLHRVHHSRWQPETDSNYAAVLSVWDRLFRTVRPNVPASHIDTGLDGFEPEHTQTLKGMLGTPFSGARAGLGRRYVPGGHGSEPPD